MKKKRKAEKIYLDGGEVCERERENMKKISVEAVFRS
jgi:hypothetical protein